MRVRRGTQPKVKTLGKAQPAAKVLELAAWERVKGLAGNRSGSALAYRAWEGRATWCMYWTPPEA